MLRRDYNGILIISIQSTCTIKKINQHWLNRSSPVNGYPGYRQNLIRKCTYNAGPSSSLLFYACANRNFSIVGVVAQYNRVMVKHCMI